MKRKKLKDEFNILHEELKEIASNKLGYPVSLTNSLYGNWQEDKIIVDSESKTKIVDNSYLGIEPGSLAEMFIVNVGAPWKKSTTSKLEVKDIEMKIIKMMSCFLGAHQDNILGYVASGGTESNLACLWWSKLWILKKLEYSTRLLKGIILEKEIFLEKSENDIFNTEIELDIYKAKNRVTEINKPVVFYTKNHTHYSLLKAFSLFSFEAIPIDSDHNGEMDLHSLKFHLEEHAKESPHRGVIINTNIYTTLMGGIDNIKEINRLAKQILGEKVHYTIHADASIGGFVLPSIKPFGDDVNDYIFDIGLNTISVSGQKVLGSVISGIALARKSFLHEAFENAENNIEYVGDILDITLSCARSGLDILCLYNSFVSLGLDTGGEVINEIINDNIENTKYFYEKLATIIDSSAIHLASKRFHIVFPRPSEKLMEKYQLMPAFSNKAVAYVLQNVNKSLIDKFIDDYSQELNLSE